MPGAAPPLEDGFDQSGARVVVCEKMPVPGGRSIRSGGGVRCADDADDTFDDPKATNAGTTLSGSLGTIGVNSSSGAVGLSSATGVLSRYVAYGIAALLLVLAFFPILGIVFFLMPRAVAGPALLFVAFALFTQGSGTVRPETSSELKQTVGISGDDIAFSM